MNTVLKHWLVSGTREYYPGKSVVRGNVIYYTFFNGISTETYTFQALTDILSLPVEPNVTLFNVLDPRSFTITPLQENILVTMPGDTVHINSAVKVNTGYGKIVCANLDYYEIATVLNQYMDGVSMLTPYITEVNITIPDHYPSRIRVDDIFAHAIGGTSLWFYKTIRLMNLKVPADFIVKIHFNSDFNYSIAKSVNLSFYWEINFTKSNITTICQDGNTYLNGQTQIYTNLTSSSVLTYRFQKPEGSLITNVTEIV